MQQALQHRERRSPPLKNGRRPSRSVSTQAGAARGIRTLVARRLREVTWIFSYFVFASFPVVLLMIGTIPRGGGFWWDFAMGLGFTGLAMLGLQFILTARFSRICAPFGTDIVYYFHRWAAVGATILIAAHYLILRTGFRDSLGSANIFDAAWHMTAGRLSALLFLVIVITSFFRKNLRIEYDRWRRVHGVLSVAAVALAIMHIRGVGFYTTTPFKSAFWTGYSALWILILIYLRIGKPWLLLRKPYRITGIRPEPGDCWTLTLKPAKAPALRFSPGQFAWLTLGASPFAGKEHPFSFSGSAESQNKLEFTIKELGDFTRTIKQFKPGDIAYVDGPHGVFSPDQKPDACGFVFIAGGIGIAPIISILRTLADRRDARPMTLIYGNSSWDRVAFKEELERLKENLNLRVVHVLQFPPAGWAGRKGIITRTLIEQTLHKKELSFQYFICGPTGMLKTVQQCLKNFGISFRQMWSEHFDLA